VFASSTAHSELPQFTCLENVCDPVT